MWSLNRGIEGYTESRTQRQQREYWQDISKGIVQESVDKSVDINVPVLIKGAIIRLSIL